MELYRPWVYHWLRRNSVRHEAAEDLTQDTLAVVLRELPAFQHSGRPGAFRAWLRAIAGNRMRTFVRSRRHRRGVGWGEAIPPTPPAGGADVLALAEQLDDPDSEPSRHWDREHDAYVLGRLLELMDLQFETRTVQAFRRTALDGATAEEVAAELGMTLAAVYIARSRVLRRLREEAAGLVDDDC